MEYVGFDRLCCAHLRWTIRVEPEQEAVWLVMTGSSAAKEILRVGFETTDLLPISVATEAGFDVSHRRPIKELSLAEITRDVNEAAARRI